MSNTCPIVVIETKNGPVEINEFDFDKDKHKLYKEPAKKAKKEPAKKSG